MPRDARGNRRVLRAEGHPRLAARPPVVAAEDLGVDRALHAGDVEEPPHVLGARLERQAPEAQVERPRRWLSSSRKNGPRGWLYSWLYGWLDNWLRDRSSPLSKTFRRHSHWQRH